MQMIPCKSCGAPLETHKCGYCGAHHHMGIRPQQIRYMRNNLDDAVRVDILYGWQTAGELRLVTGIYDASVGIGK